MNADLFNHKVHKGITRLTKSFSQRRLQSNLRKSAQSARKNINPRDLSADRQVCVLFNQFPELLQIRFKYFLTFSFVIVNTPTEFF